MMLIGIDPHKSTHTATAVDPATNSDLGSVRIEASFVGYRQLLAWSRQWSEHRRCRRGECRGAAQRCPRRAC